MATNEANLRLSHASPEDERWLRFRLGGTPYAIPVSRVSGLGDLRGIRTVPGSPAEILGLSEWRGRLLTVIDLAAVLGVGRGNGPACLIRLAAPYLHTAFQISHSVRLDTAKQDAVVLDPASLVVRLEAEILAGSSLRPCARVVDRDVAAEG